METETKMFQTSSHNTSVMLACEQAFPIDYAKVGAKSKVFASHSQGRRVTAAPRAGTNFAPKLAFYL